MSQVTLPAIGADLRVGPSSLQWVVSGYVLGFGGFLLLGGRTTEAGWLSVRTLGMIAAASLALLLFIAVERRIEVPLVRLGILRSGPLVRANLGAASLFGAWVGFLFITTLYLQDMRSWSSLETGLAVAPSGAMVVLLASRIGPVVTARGPVPLIVLGLSCSTTAYLLYQRIGTDSPYATVVLPTVLLGGLGFALAYGPLNIAATAGVAAHEQGLASGLVSCSFQLGGALALALVSAVITAVAGRHLAAGSRLSAFHAGLWMCAAIALTGLLVCAWPLRPGAIPNRLAEETP